MSLVVKPITLRAANAFVDSQKMLRRVLDEMEEHGHTIYETIKGTLGV